MRFNLQGVRPIPPDVYLSMECELCKGGHHGFLNLLAGFCLWIAKAVAAPAKIEKTRGYTVEGVFMWALDCML